MKVIILLGYGVFTEDNLQYKEYLDEALKIIDKSSPDMVITTGAMTNKDKRGLLESSSQRDYLVKCDPELASKMQLENHSISTPQNILFSKQLLQEKSIQPESITIICDSIRAPKVFYLACTYLNDILHLDISEEEIYSRLLHHVTDTKMDITKGAHYSYKNLSIEGVNLHRSIDEVGLQVTSSMIEVGFTKYPQLEEEFLKWRKEQFEMN